MSKPYHSWVLIWGAVIVALFPGGPLAAADGPPALEVKKPEFKGARMSGTVTRLGKDGFSIKGWVNQPVAPKRYNGELHLQLSADLRAGRFSPGTPAAQSYLPENLRVGDGVLIEFDRRGGAAICTSIMIYKRPGGRVPPSPNVKEDEKIERAFGYKWHEGQNARNDWQDRGIPLPDKFKPKVSRPIPTDVPGIAIPTMPTRADAPSSPPIKPIPPAKP